MLLIPVGRWDAWTTKLSIERLTLVQIVAILLETTRPLLDASTRQSIRQATSIADLAVLAIGDVVVPLDQTEPTARSASR